MLIKGDANTYMSVYGFEPDQIMTILLTALAAEMSFWIRVFF